jgi:hypothetical protein
MAMDGPLAIPIPSGRVAHETIEYPRLPKRYALSSQPPEEPLESPSGYSDWAPRSALQSIINQRTLKVRNSNVESGRGRSAGLPSPTVNSPAPSAYTEAFQDCTSDGGLLYFFGRGGVDVLSWVVTLDCKQTIVHLEHISFPALVC